MTITELKEELARKMQDVRSRKLWQTAFQIATDFGKKDVRVGSDTTQISFDLTINIETVRFRIRISPYYYGHLQIFVEVNGDLVFSASEVEDSERKMPWVEKEVTDLLTMNMEKKFRKHIGTKVCVERYVPGDWSKLFEYSVFVKAVDTLMKKEASREAKTKRDAEQNRQLSEQENRLAVEFGIQTGVRVPPHQARSVR